MKFIPLFVLCWVSCAAAQTFHIAPANPILVGERLSIEVDGLPADQNVTLSAERTMDAANGGGAQVLYRSQAVFSAPHGALDLATAKPLSGTYSDEDIHGLFWSMVPVPGAPLGELQPSQVKLTAAVDGRVLGSTTLEFIDSLPRDPRAARGVRGYSGRSTQHSVRMAEASRGSRCCPRRVARRLEGCGPGVEPGTRSSFALDGKPLPFVPYLEFAQELDGFRTGREVRMRRFQDKGRAANPAAAVKARIEVEKFRGPLLVIGGHDDQVWASGMMAQSIAERRAAAGLETVALIFPEAGHAIAGSGWLPTTQYNVGLSKVGGTPQANAAAQARAFPQTLAFLKRTLRVASDAQR